MASDLTFQSLVDQEPQVLYGIAKSKHFHSGQGTHPPAKFSVFTQQRRAGFQDCRGRRGWGAHSSSDPPAEKEPCESERTCPSQSPGELREHLALNTFLSSSHSKVIRRSQAEIRGCPSPASSEGSGSQGGGGTSEPRSRQEEHSPRLPATPLESQGPEKTPRAQGRKRQKRAASAMTYNSRTDPSL